ncbi:MAG: MFS transporter [Erysipelotrichaceae bacterium]
MDTLQSISYKHVLQNKNYLLFSIGNWISRFGDSLDSIAYAWMVYALTGSTALMALLFGLNALPNVLFQPIGGVVVSYFRKKDVLLITNFGRALIVTLTAILFANQRLEVWHLFLFTILASSLESLQGPASMSCYPLLLEQEAYGHAMGLSRSMSQAMELFGLAVAGILLGTIGIAWTLCINALTFYLCGLLQFLTKYKNEVIKRQTLSLATITLDLKEGFHYLLKQKQVAYLVVFGSLFGILIIPLNTLGVALVSDVYQKGPEVLSLISGGLTLGMLIGSLLYPILRKQINQRTIFLSCGFIFGLVHLIIPIWDHFTIVGLIGFPMLLGMVAAGIVSMVNVTFMELVEPVYLPRVSGVFNSLAMAATPLGSMMVASICIFVPLPTLFFGFGLAIIGLFSVQCLVKVLHQLP